MITRMPGCVAGILLLMPGVVAAQDLPLVMPGTTPKCQFEPGSIRDTIEFRLFLTPPRSVAKAGSQRDAYTPYIMAIASTFQQPKYMSVSFYPAGSDADENGADAIGDCDAWCEFGPLEGEVQFRLRNGRVSDISWWLVPDSPEIMRAIEQAIRAGDSLRLFPEAPKLKGLPTGTVRLAMRLARWPPAIGGTPIAHVPLPLIKGVTPVEVIFQPVPHYPSIPAEFVPGGAVELQYVVAEDGLVPEGTVRVLKAEHQIFIRPAVQAILRSRFRPATAGGCPVRQMVHQRVVYRR
jgi:hypothetical protein